MKANNPETSLCRASTFSLSSRGGLVHAACIDVYTMVDAVRGEIFIVYTSTIAKVLYLNV